MTAPTTAITSETIGLLILGFGLFVLFVVSTLVVFKLGGGVNLLQGIKNAMTSKEDKLPEDEATDNDVKDMDLSREFLVRKMLPNGSYFEDITNKWCWSGNNLVFLNESKKLTDKPLHNYCIRGEQILQLLNGNTKIIIDIEDSDAISSYQNEIGRLKIQIVNLQARLDEKIQDVKDQIVSEHEVRKEITKARFGGNDPKQQNSFNPFRRYGGGIGQGQTEEEEV